MKALISTIEPRETGYRVAQVEQTEFPMAEAFFWVDCADDVVADQFWYDPQDKSIKSIPNLPPNSISIPGQPQPEVQGAQTI